MIFSVTGRRVNQATLRLHTLFKLFEYSLWVEVFSIINKIAGLLFARRPAGGDLRTCYPFASEILVSRSSSIGIRLPLIGGSSS